MSSKVLAPQNENPRRYIPHYGNGNEDDEQKLTDSDDSSEQQRRIKETEREILKNEWMNESLIIVACDDNIRMLLLNQEK